jgi:hypothetical protein
LKVPVPALESQISSPQQISRFFGGEHQFQVGSSGRSSAFSREIKYEIFAEFSSQYDRDASFYSAGFSRGSVIHPSSRSSVLSLETRQSWCVLHYADKFSTSPLML